MRGLADGVEILRVGARVVLFNHNTGRHVPLPGPGLSTVSPGLADRLGREGMIAGTEVPTGHLFPARSWLALGLGNVLWHADPTVPPRGGHAWRAEPLSPWEQALWANIDGRRRVSDLARDLGEPPARVLGTLRRLSDARVQAVQLRRTPVPTRDPGLQRILCADPTAPVRTAEMYGSDNTTDLGAWHGELTSAERHFDDVETTVAHALGNGHPGLSGRTYGEALYDRLGARGWVRGRVVEVGPGSGQLAEAFLRRAGHPLDYTRVDASPALLAAQDERLPGTTGLLGNALSLPLPDHSVDLIFANEVIADLPSRPTRRGWINTGSFAFLAEIRRVLRPGGHFWLSEFGTLDDEPEETTGLDHPEVSIQFTALLHHARSLGLAAEVQHLPGELGMDLTAPQLWRGSYEGLRAWFRATGATLEARAWTPSNLDLPFPVDGLRFVTLADRGPGPLVTRFYSLGSPGGVGG